jgi:hypothetical protein
MRDSIDFTEIYVNNEGEWGARPPTVSKRAYVTSAARDGAPRRVQDNLRVDFNFLSPPTTRAASKSNRNSVDVIVDVPLTINWLTTNRSQ